MLAGHRTWLVPVATALLAVAGVAGAADAGWVSIKNDTNRVIVVQGSATAKGQSKRCKPVRLLPGETAREYHLPPFVTVDVFDGRNPTKLLHTGTVPIRGEHQGFSISVAGSGIVIRPAPGH